MSCLITMMYNQDLSTSYTNSSQSFLGETEPKGKAHKAWSWEGLPPLPVLVRVQPLTCCCSARHIVGSPTLFPSITDHSLLTVSFLSSWYRPQKRKMDLRSAVVRVAGLGLCISESSSTSHLMMPELPSIIVTYRVNGDLKGQLDSRL